MAVTIAGITCQELVADYGENYNIMDATRPGAEEIFISARGLIGSLSRTASSACRRLPSQAG